MPLQYELYKNKLGTNPKGYYARVVKQQVHDRTKLIELMVHRGTSLTKADIEAALTCLDQVIMQIIKNGEGVNTGLFNIHLDVKGGFANVHSHFNPNEHKLAISINATKQLKEQLGEIEVQKVYSSGNESKIIKVEDTLSRTTNTWLSPGGPVRVFGYLIKIIAAQPSDDKEGLYVVSLSDGSSSKFPTEITNKPSQLIYLAPTSLKKGDYKLEVRTYGISNTAKSGKNLKVISSNIIFKVK